jgi:hypothetical protein
VFYFWFVFTDSIFLYWQNPLAIALMIFGVTFGVCHSSCKDRLIGLSSWSQTFLALMLHQFSFKAKFWANLISQGTLADDLFMIKRQQNFLMSICFLWNLFGPSPQNWCFLLVDNWGLFRTGQNFRSVSSQKSYKWESRRCELVFKNSRERFLEHIKQSFESRRSKTGFMVYHWAIIIVNGDL